VGLGEAAVCYALGVPMILALRRAPQALRLAGEEDGEKSDSQKS
jgi:hypothetical protein